MTSRARGRRFVLGLAVLGVVLSVDSVLAQGKSKVEIVPQIAHSGYVDAVAFSPDGMHVLSGSFDYTLKLWDTATGQLIRTFQGHLGEVYSVTFSPDGARVLSRVRCRRPRLMPICKRADRSIAKRDIRFMKSKAPAGHKDEKTSAAQ
jgi:WD40 repeat protein